MVLGPDLPQAVDELLGTADGGAPVPSEAENWVSSWCSSQGSPSAVNSTLNQPETTAMAFGRSVASSRARLKLVDSCWYPAP
ncbi:hypothetical protein M878_40975 [Streptomyces roseochromogenus subsp. oscitans DS 12.976]|uniref:Uncharacterized protein n=1 Tax=Streptomyces roseochromogenus subsp. oscitans DS 12.976 TaxID=1352936 RepID=V6JJQ6_STRRC|nr:hypothetical protein M878_40975 [Streptomyces roseochromogenus subsp. oscitans DS 12.976]